LIQRAAAKGHPWPSAAKPASCRFARRINIEFRPAWFDGAPKIKSQIKSQIKSARGGLKVDLFLCRWFAVLAVVSISSRMNSHPESITDESVGDSMLACNAVSCGTGFSREGGISGDQFRAGVPASSRLKPVPHENAVFCTSLLAKPTTRSPRKTASSFIASKLGSYR
jgi:hypothetical protein